MIKCGIRMRILGFLYHITHKTTGKALSVSLKSGIKKTNIPFLYQRDKVRRKLN